MNPEAQAPKQSKKTNVCTTSDEMSRSVATRLRAVISLFLSLTLVFSLVPGAALAEGLSEGSQALATQTGNQGEPKTSDEDNVNLLEDGASEPSVQADDVTSGGAGSGSAAAGGAESGDATVGDATPDGAGSDSATPDGATVDNATVASGDATAGAGSDAMGAATAVPSEADGTNAAADTSSAPDADVAAQAATTESQDIDVAVGLASESNIKKDICVGLTYNDNFFEQPSDVYNDDLAYASTCMASAAVNSNEGGDDYKAKAKNIVSFLQQIECDDVETNDGYNYKPMEAANIGVAIGHKDIFVNGTTYRLFVFAVRGSSYEAEWAVNMRVGTEGDATGFQEARDGILGFVMPYIKKYTDGLDGDVNVKVWGTGYCRGGCSANLAFGWLNKWVYERNAGHPYKDYTQSYNAEHSVYGASYSKTERRYTKQVSFPTNDYLADNVKISQNDIYAYSVNCPCAADGADVANHEAIMVGIHNLINPDDWFPQVIMNWWGFNRYGYTHDHDITGTYPTDGSLHSRDRSVWNPEDVTRQEAVATMVKRLKALDPDTAFNSTFFRQRYFSKMSVVKNAIKKAVGWLWGRIKTLWSSEPTTIPDVFEISIDAEGEGNVYFSKGTELKYNQGAYYQEFLKFVLASAGFPDDPAAARKYYVDNYQDAFVNLAEWVLGQKLEVRENLPKVASRQVEKAFKQLAQEGFTGLGEKENTFLKSVGLLLTDSVTGTYISYIGAAVWASVDSNAKVPSLLIGRTMQLTLDSLKIPYEREQVDRVGTALGKLAYNYYDNEQRIGKFNFFHSLTMLKAGSSIAQSHWPEQSLSWFSQCRPATQKPRPKSDVEAQSIAAKEGSEAMVAQAAPSSHEVWAYFEEDPEYLYGIGERENGEIVGPLVEADELDEEGIFISSWNMYDYVDFVTSENPQPIKTVEEDYEFQASDPEVVVLVPNIERLESKRINLWLNQAMTGFDQDVLIGSFDVYDGGYYYLAYTSLPEGLSDEGFNVYYYGGNENLIHREGVWLEGWVNAAESEDDLVVFPADGFVDYGMLPDGDVVDLYAVWCDPLVYGVTYYANRSASDDYMVETAQFSQDGATLAIDGLEEGDAGLQNPGKTFKGWNTAADGSGTWVNTGENASLAQLGLGTRAQYVEDLVTLADLRVQEMPDHYVESEADSAADEFEAQLEPKYTARLYAQWSDASPTPAPAPAPTPAPTPASAPTNTTKPASTSQLPRTADAMTAVDPMVLVLAVVAIAAGVAIRRRSTQSTE